MMDKEQYQKEMSELFAKWEQKPLHKDKIFVKDGVINPKRFFSNSVRPLFVLKEAYGKTEANNDIAEEHNCDTGENTIQRRSTWPNISRWTYAIFNSQKSIEIESEEFYRKKNRYLQEIAVINIKKSSGRSSSSHSNLLKYVKADHELLKKQIEVIDPTIIICGYTLSLLYEIFPSLLCQKERLQEKHFATFALNNHDVLVLDCYHPSKRSSAQQLYDIFSNLYQTAQPPRS